MKRLVVIIAILVINAGYCKEYQPLTGKEKKEFLQVYKSIVEAYKGGNYSIVQKFSPEIIEKYEAIMLDSKSEDLRPKYKEISDILVNSKRLFIRDSLMQLIYQKHKLQKNSECADGYQDLFAFIDKEGVFDSLKKKETPHLYECIVKMYEENPSYATFEKIDHYRYSNREYIEKIRKKIENEFEDKLLKLSSEMNVDTLLDFKQKYPGVLQSDIESLLEKAKDKYRLSILRKINPGSVKAYYDKFGGPNDELELALERNMYDKFDKEKSKDNAEDYQYRFPKGKRIEIINNYLRIQTNVAMPDSAISRPIR